MLHLLRGTDHLTLREAVADLCTHVSTDPAMRELNVARFDGAAIALADLDAAAQTWPFLAERRVVLVEGLSRQLEVRDPKKQPAAGDEQSTFQAPADAAGARATDQVTPDDEPKPPDEPEVVAARIESFAAFFAAFQEQTGRPPAEGGLPCDLVLVEPEAATSTRRRTAVPAWQGSAPGDPGRGGQQRAPRPAQGGRMRASGLEVVASLVEEAGGEVRIFDGPSQQDLSRWIAERARRVGVQIDARAVQLLADAVGPDTALLVTELEKLKTFAGDGRVTADDVRLLVAETRAAKVFELGDLVIRGDRERAVALLEHLGRDGEYPLKILQLLVRHVRQFIEAESCVQDTPFRSLGSRGRPAPEELKRHETLVRDLSRRLGMPAWRVERLAREGSGTSVARLHGALDALLAADTAVKRGHSRPEDALLLAVLQLSATRQAQAPRTAQW